MSCFQFSLFAFLDRKKAEGSTYKFVVLNIFAGKHIVTALLEGSIRDYEHHATNFQLNKVP